jgi:hypothetical protein
MFCTCGQNISTINIYMINNKFYCSLKCFSSAVAENDFNNKLNRLKVNTK